MRVNFRWLALLLILCGGVLGADPSATDKGRVHALKITMLSTMLADGAG